MRPVLLPLNADAFVCFNAACLLFVTLVLPPRLFFHGRLPPLGKCVNQGFAAAFHLRHFVASLFGFPTRLRGFFLYLIVRFLRLLLRFLCLSRQRVCHFF